MHVHTHATTSPHRAGLDKNGYERERCVKEFNAYKDCKAEEARVHTCTPCSDACDELQDSVPLTRAARRLGRCDWTASMSGSGAAPFSERACPRRRSLT